MARAVAAVDALKLTAAVESLPGVTAARGAALRALGIPTLAHLIHHLPFRHERVEPETPIEGMKAGAIVTAAGEVTATRVTPRGKRPRFEVVLVDHTGRVDVVFFNQSYLTKQIVPGDVIRVQGKANRFGPGGQSLQIVNPKWWKVKEDDEAPKVGRLRPVYPASEGAPSAFIDGVIQKVLDRALPLIGDHLSEEFRRERSLPELREAYRMIHRPASQGEVDEARRRLIYDELLLLQLGVRMKREYVRKSLHAPALKWSSLMDERIRARLPFKLTAGQEKVVREIREDLGRSTPANRLIQGDVGSGKTAVAVYAMLMAVASKRQAALMAPTQLLAEQHYATISAMLEGSKVRVALVTGADRAGKKGERQEVGEFDIAIGTHALLSEGVKFDSLAVAVIDEQHRFGVHQRARLRERSGDGDSSPHVLVMTATPIPRTLSLTIFGDLDVSAIRGLPPGRARIASRAVPASRAGEVFEYVRKRIEKGEQAYIVAPTIDPGSGDDPGLRAVRPTMDLLINVTSFFRNPSVFEALKRKVFPRLVKNNTGGDTLRVWVAGCSTGQEAYSIAMAYTEFAEQSSHHLPIQIFATDVNPQVLDPARIGRYARSQLEGVSAARLQRFFTKEHGGYRVAKAIRDMVIFAQQNLLIDPPFTRVDLVSCRNMLIYIEPALQQKIIPAFHYALRPNGMLLLGSSESIGQFTTLFEPAVKGQKIYVKKPAASLMRYERPPTLPMTKALRVTLAPKAAPDFSPVEAFKEADRLTLMKYAPVSLLVNEEGDILQFRGDVRRYLDLPTGRATFQLLKLAREGLSSPLQKACLRAKRDNKTVRERGIRFDRRRG
ncbi:MAG TPA: CheR family methyltransferase, partial [Phycisphaerales bacterium]|nr:CheR family methyltransferase [Phycisphaerales bacterium]